MVQTTKPAGIWSDNYFETPFTYSTRSLDTFEMFIADKGVTDAYFTVVTLWRVEVVLDHSNGSRVLFTADYHELGIIGRLRLAGLLRDYPLQTNPQIRRRICGVVTALWSVSP